MRMPARPGSAYRPGSLVEHFCLLEPLEVRLLLAGMPELDPGVVLTCGGAAIDSDWDTTPFVIDWNNDGKKDLLVGQYTDGLIRLYINEGTDAAPVFNSVSYVQSGGTPITTSYG